MIGDLPRRVRRLALDVLRTGRLRRRRQHRGGAAVGHQRRQDAHRSSTASPGSCAGIAGVIQVGRLGAASPMVGADIPLNAAAAVLLGGTSFLGGVGGVSGTAVGVLFIGTLQNGLAIAGVSELLAAGRDGRHPDRRDRDRPVAAGQQPLVAQGDGRRADGWATRAGSGGGLAVPDELEVLWQPLKLRGATLPNRIMCDGHHRAVRRGRPRQRPPPALLPRARARRRRTALHRAADGDAAQRHGLPDLHLGARRAAGGAPRQGARGTRALPDALLRPARRGRRHRGQHRRSGRLGAGARPVEHRRARR